MTQISAIIKSAYRESNLVDIKATPTPDEEAEGLSRLQALIKSTVGNEAGFALEDWTAASTTVITDPSGVALSAAQTSAYFVEPQTRLMCNLTIATSLALDPFPNDGQRFAVIDVAGNFNTYNLTLNGNGRRVNGGASLVLSTDDEIREFFFRSDLGDWVEIKTFIVSDQLPFPVDYDDYFITALAMRLNPAHQREISQATSGRFELQQAHISARYQQSRLRSG